MLMKNIIIFIALAALFQGAAFAQSDSVRVAVSRFKVEGGKNLKEFLGKINKDVEYAIKNKAKYLLLPELISLDLFPVNPKNVPEEIARTAGFAEKIKDFLKARAKDNNLVIVGSTLYVSQNGKTKNQAYAYSPKGLIGVQNKIYPTPWEIKHEISGGGEIKLFKTEDFSFVVLVCHDTEFPNVSMSLKDLRPEVIFVPYQTDTVQGRNRVVYTGRARAVEHMSYVVASGPTSIPGAKWHTYQGGAHLFRPQNKYFELGGVDRIDGAEPALFSLDLSKLRKARSDKGQVYPARDI